MRAVILIFDTAAERREFFSHNAVNEALSEANIDAMTVEPISAKVANAAIRAQATKARAKRKAKDKRLAKLHATQKTNRAELRDSGSVWTYSKVHRNVLDFMPKTTDRDIPDLDGATLEDLGVNLTELRAQLHTMFGVDCIMGVSLDTTFEGLVEWVHDTVRLRTT